MPSNMDSDEYIARIFNYLNDNPETIITLTEGTINKDLLVARGRAPPRIVRGFMRHSMQKSPRNLIFSFKGIIDGEEAKTYQFHLTMAKKAPSLLPLVPSLDLSYIGEYLQNINDGGRNKHFKIQAFYNHPDKFTYGDATKKLKDDSDKQPEATVTAENLARELFLRNDPGIRAEAISALMKDETLRAEARQKIFEFFEKDGSIKITLQNAYAEKFEKDREAEKLQHHELLAKLQQDKEDFLKEHRKVIKDSQAKILNMTAQQILETEKYRNYRESAIILAASKLESDPVVRSNALKMAQRALLLEKRDDVGHIDIQVSGQIEPPKITPEDRSAAIAFVSQN